MSGKRIRELIIKLRPEIAKIDYYQNKSARIILELIHDIQTTKKCNLEDYKFIERSYFATWFVEDLTREERFLRAYKMKFDRKQRSFRSLS